MRPTRLNQMAARTLAVVASVMLASGTAGATPTAAQVKDDESLKAFVEEVKAQFEATTDANRMVGLTSKLRSEGDWKSGPMFLIIFFNSG